MITREWLNSLNIYESEFNHNEYEVRVGGASDEEHLKTNSDNDKVGDEVNYLTLILNNKGDVHCFLETFDPLAETTTGCVALGVRKTQEEVLLLLKALKAWYKVSESSTM